MFRKLLLVVAICFYTFNIFAQNYLYKPLKRGEKVPDISLIQSIGDSIFSASFSDYNGKFILLDFWSTNCLDCISSMPKMLALQKEFDKNLQILLVTSNSKEEIKLLQQKLKNNKIASNCIKAGLTMPLITNDTLLNKLFPYTALPTHVWINPDRTLRSITYSSSTNHSSLKKLINGEGVLLDEQYPMDLKPDSPLTWITENNSLLSKVSSYSFFMKHIEFGGGASSLITSIRDTITQAITGISMINCSMLDLYKYAYQFSIPSLFPLPDNRVVLETSLKENFVFYGSSENLIDWCEQFTYCYGLKVKKEDSSYIFKFMQNDLDRFFNLKSKIEERFVKCYILKESGKVKNLHSIGQQTKVEKFFRNDMMYYNLQHIKMKTLVTYLQNIFYIWNRFNRLVDQTKFEGYFDLELPIESLKESKSISYINQFLSKFGLEISEKYIKFPMLVISDK